MLATSSDPELLEVLGVRALVPKPNPSVVFVGTEAIRQGLDWIRAGRIQYGKVAFATDDGALRAELVQKGFQGFQIMSESAALRGDRVSVDAVELELAPFLDFRSLDYVISAFTPDPAHRAVSLTLERVMRILSNIDLIPVLRDAPTRLKAIDDAQVFLDLSA